MVKLKSNNKVSGGTLTHVEWNESINKINEVIDELDLKVSTSNEQYTKAINTTNVLNSSNVKTHITSKNNLEIETFNKTLAEKVFTKSSSFSDDLSKIQLTSAPSINIENADFNKYYPAEGGYDLIIASESPNINLESDSAIKLVTTDRCVWDIIPITSENFSSYLEEVDGIMLIPGGGLKMDTDPEIKYVDGKIYVMSNNENDKKADVNVTEFVNGYKYVKCRQLSETSGISLSSDEKIKISGKKVTIEGFQGFEPSMTFGEAEEGIKLLYKATKKGKNKLCDVIQIEVFNNSTESIVFDKGTHKASNSDLLGAAEANGDVPTFCLTLATVPAKSSVVVAQASVYDMIMLINYMKTNNQGPWASV